MNFDKEVLKWYEKLSSKEKILYEMNKLGWTIKMVEQKSELKKGLPLAKSDIVDQIIYISERINKNDIQFIYLHEFFHILEGRMANYIFEADKLEVADYFAAAILFKNNKDEVDNKIPKDRMMLFTNE